jgi:hypothetical protein
MGSPQIPEEEPQNAPPPPTPLTEELKVPEVKKRRNSRRRGASGLTIRRRPSVNVGGTQASLRI